MSVPQVDQNQTRRRILTMDPSSMQQLWPGDPELENRQPFQYFVNPNYSPVPGAGLPPPPSDNDSRYNVNLADQGFAGSHADYYHLHPHPPPHISMDYLEEPFDHHANSSSNNNNIINNQNLPHDLKNHPTKIDHQAHGASRNDKPDGNGNQQQKNPTTSSIKRRWERLLKIEVQVYH